MTTMRTALGKVRGLGSAREGTMHFWRQRLTGIALVPLTLFFVWVVVRAVGREHAEVVAMLGSPLVAILMLAVIGAMVIHMRLGMQVIIEDYVHGEPAKALSLMANTFFSIFVGIAAVWAVVKLSFGI